MKVSYLAYIRLPNEKAHGIQIMKVCEAIASEGIDLKLFIPGRKTHLTEDPFLYYNVRENFSIVTKKVIDFTEKGKVGFIFSELFFSLRTFFSTMKDEVIISQDEWVLLLHTLVGRRCVYEVHNGRSNFAANFVSKRALCLVANSNGTRNFYVERGIETSKIILLPNGVETETFEIRESISETRSKLQLPLDKKLVLYTGHLYDWKGVETLAESAEYLPEDVLVVFVGGTEKDVASFKVKYGNKKNILILGHKRMLDIPLYLHAADILVLPNARVGESERFTSPMKVFEYLAAGKPIVASDLPSIREVLNDENAFFFSPGDANSLAQVLEGVLLNRKDAEEKVTKAKLESRRYTWSRKVLVDYLKKVIV